MSIKPVAWMCDANDGANADATASDRVRDDYARFGRTITPLIALPDTHRVVPIDLLHAIEIDMAMECTNFDTLNKLRAIIEDKQL